MRYDHRAALPPVPQHRVDHFYTYDTLSLLSAWYPTLTATFSTSTSELMSSVTDNGYVLEGVSAAVFPTQQGTTLPLYRLYNSNMHDHFYTCVHKSAVVSALL